ncbi:MAG: YebC/PmpR family DNA-binding transcriptional regulator [Patescibacteria group bacterium]|jgi:YebC/PmpR family DNA-binding regulatory protein
MSGHSKWSQIKRQKGANDQKRSGVFTKLSKNISIAAKKGKDPESNSALRSAIDAARAASMPKDGIEKAILRGAGELPGQIIEEVVYEGYGPGGVAFIINCITDNKNRSSAFIKSTLSKHGGSLGGPNTVAYLFKKRGVLRIENSNEDTQLKAIDAGAEDIKEEDNGLTVYVLPEKFEETKKIFDNLDYSSMEMVPENRLDVSSEIAEKLNKLLTELEENDDVNETYTNADL